MNDIFYESIKVDEQTNSIIKKELQEIYYQNLNSPFKKLLFTKLWMIINLSVYFTDLLFIIISIFLLIDKKTEAGIILLLLALFLLAWSIIFSLITKKFRDRIKNQIDKSKIINCYNHVASNSTKNLTIKDIIHDFSIVPEAFMPENHLNNTIKIENVITGIYKEQDFNFGTVLEKVVKVKYQERELLVFNRYLFLTMTIELYDFITTIKPEGFIDKVIHRNDIKLESSEFEKIFAVDHSNSIKLRKLLQPKVMAVMIDFTDECETPYIYLNRTQITLMLPYKDIDMANLQDLVFNFRIANNVNTTLTNITTTIEYDLTRLIKVINWIQILQLV